MEIDFNELKIETEPTGRGAFGTVYKGTVSNKKKKISKKFPKNLKNSIILKKIFSEFS